MARRIEVSESVSSSDDAGAASTPQPNKQTVIDRIFPLCMLALPRNVRDCEPELLMGLDLTPSPEIVALPE
jgi:hypothetical protein